MTTHRRVHSAEEHHDEDQSTRGPARPRRRRARRHRSRGLRPLAQQQGARRDTRSGSHDTIADRIRCPHGETQPRRAGRHPAPLATHRCAPEGPEEGEARRGGGEGAGQQVRAPAARDRQGRHRLRRARGLSRRRRLQRHPAGPGVPLADGRHRRTRTVDPPGRHPVAEPDERDHRQHRRREVGDQLRQALPQAPRGHALVHEHPRHGVVRHRPVAGLHLSGPDLLRPGHRLSSGGAGQADQALPQRTAPVLLPVGLVDGRGQHAEGQEGTERSRCPTRATAT